MKKQEHTSTTYLKFLNLVAAIRDLPGFPDVDPVEERLLDLFAAAWHSGRKITVLEAMGMLTDISASTAHRRIKHLRQKGLLALEIDDIDNRVKYVVPTPQTNQYFAKLGDCLDKAASAS